MHVYIQYVYRQLCIILPLDQSHLISMSMVSLVTVFSPFTQSQVKDTDTTLCSTPTQSFCYSETQDRTAENPLKWFGVSQTDCKWFNQIDIISLIKFIVSSFNTEILILNSVLCISFELASPLKSKCNQ